MRRVLLLPIGSSGDVNPFLWIGRQLRARGHDVAVVANPVFAAAVAAAGLRLVPFGTEEEYHALIDDPAVWHPTRGTPIVLGFAGEITARHYEIIRAEAAAGPLLLLAPATAFGARLAREKLGLPLVTVNLQPSIYRSIHATAHFGRGLGWLTRAPRTVRRAFFALLDLHIDRYVAPGVRRACQSVGVIPPRNAFRDWWQSPDGAICLFPEWFAAPQTDWNPRPACIGFPLEDLAGQQPPNAELAAFLEAGDSPILFTAGTAMAHAHDFFAVARDACLAFGRRALFLTRYPEQLPIDLPTTIAHFPYIPFSEVLPRCAAIVHHGGIGTTSQALAAGIPQLIMPIAHDQPDNATRIRRLGVGTFLWPHEFTAANLVRTLPLLLENAALAEECARVAERVREENPSTKLLDALAARLSS